MNVLIKFSGIKKYGFALWILTLLLTGLACKDTATKVVKTEPITFTKEGTLTLLRSETDSILGQLDIEIADNEYETQTGLMYRQSLGAREGMLFIFPREAMHSFYMKNTEIPLDLLFIDSDLKIVHLVENAEPLNETGLSSQRPVQYVLEVNSGLANEWHLQVGDRITFQKSE